MLITKEIGIDTGHRVMGHQTKCFNSHGHRYQIEVGVEDKVISVAGAPDEGMVIDFGDLKSIMMEVLDKGFDHGTIIFNKDYRMRYAMLDGFALLEDKEVQALLKKKLPYFNELFAQYKNERDKAFKVKVVPFTPTAENLSEYWYGLLKEKLLERKIKIKYVKVWETPTSTATYQED